MTDRGRRDQGEGGMGLPTGGVSRIMGATGGSQLSFEVAREGDLPDILTIERSSFPAPWSWNLFMQELEAAASRVLVARLAFEEGRPLVGYVCWSAVAGEMHLLNLAVHPDGRRAGIGKRLLQLVLDDARAGRAEAVYLEVRETNLAAARLYRSAGFVQVGRRRDYYGHGENAVLMTLRLNPRL